MTAFLDALRSFLALYGIGSRAPRRRPSAVYIGRTGGG
jgi:hypothetical protein